MFGSWISKTLDRRSMLLTAAGGAIAAMAPGRASGQASQPVKRALALGGGSILGAYQAGAIKALFNKGFAPDYLYGISAGSLNAAFLCDRAYYLAKPKSTYYSELKETPPADAGDLSAPVNWPFIGERLVDFWQQKITAPAKLVKEWPELGVAVHAFMSDFNGFLSVAPLSRLVKNTLSDQRLQASKAVTAIGAVNIDTAKIKYVPNSDPDFKNFVLASAAVPLVMPIVEIKSGANAGRYVDGGVKHIVPVGQAATAGPATHIVSIVCQAPVRAENYQPVADPKDVIQLVTRLTDIASDNVIANDISEAKNKKVAMIRPDTPLETEIHKPAVEINNFNRSDIQNLIARGEFYADRQIAAGKELTAEFFG